MKRCNQPSVAISRVNGFRACADCVNRMPYPERFMMIGAHSDSKAFEWCRGYQCDTPINRIPRRSEVER